MIAEQLAASIDRLVAELPPGLIRGVLARLELAKLPIRAGDLSNLTVLQPNRGMLADVESQLIADPQLDGRLVAVAVRTCMLAAERARRRSAVEIAWTGPGTSIIPVRRVDQVMYEMVAEARESVLLMSFVAYKANRLLEELSRARGRGVDVTLILERAEDSDGKLEFDGLNSIRAKLPEVSIYHWPRERREINEQGKTGILHAKCLICDDRRALVSSANLTDYALEWNMELGLLVSGEDVPVRIANHLRQLMLQGHLRKVD